MAILLCTASVEELAALLRPFPQASGLTLAEHEYCHIVPKGLGTPHIYALCSGVGPLNAALALGKTLSALVAEKVYIEKVLIAGLAGAFNLERFPLGSFCWVKEEIWPEYGLHDGHEVIAQAFKFPQWVESPQGPIYDRLKLTDLESFNLKPKQFAKFKEASSLTVAGVSASFARAQDLFDRYHADLENMEGFAFAYGCLRNKLSSAEIRVVSNKTGPRKSDEKDFAGALDKLSELLPTLNLS